MTFIPLAIFALLFLFPPVTRGTRATHNALRITMPRTMPGRKYVLTQERGEYRLHKLFALLAGLPFLAITSETPLLIAVGQFLAMFAVDQLTRLIEAIDWAGHGAEIMAAEKDGQTGYRAKEIADLENPALNMDKRGDDVPAMLAKWNWLAILVRLLGSV